MNTQSTLTASEYNNKTPIRSYFIPTLTLRTPSPTVTLTTSSLLTGSLEKNMKAASAA